jgi:hypothetical protein
MMSLIFQITTLSLARNINAVRFTSDGQKVDRITLRCKDNIFGKMNKPLAIWGSQKWESAITHPPQLFHQVKERMY